MLKRDCPHLSQGKGAEPETDGCLECGDSSSIRLCLSCGHVGCCDSTKGHATAHFRQSGHPIIRSLPLAERGFTWCYLCDDYLR